MRAVQETVVIHQKANQQPAVCAILLAKVRVLGHVMIHVAHVLPDVARVPRAEEYVLTVVRVIVMEAVIQVAIVDVIPVVIVVVWEAARVIAMVNAPHVMVAPTVVAAMGHVASDVIHRAMRVHTQVCERK